MRTLLLEPVQHGSKTLSPVQVESGKRIFLSATCLGEGRFTLDLELLEVEDESLGLDFDCDRDRAVPNFLDSRVHSTSKAVPKVITYGDVQWSLRIEHDLPE